MSENQNKPTSQSGHQILAQEARVRDFRMKRTDAAYTDGEMAKLRADLLDHKGQRRNYANKPISWEKLADKIGTTAAVLNQWVHNKYPGDVQSIARAVDQYLSDELSRTQRLEIGFRSIENAKLALATLGETVRQNSIGAVIGPAGCGKTMVRRYVEVSRAGTISITIDEHSGDRIGVTQKLYDAVVAAGWRLEQPPRGSRGRWNEARAFFGRNRNSLLLVDEAQKLTTSGLEVLRDLHDQSDESGERNIPIVLFGDSRFYKLLLRTRAGQSSPIGPQFARRIAPIFDYERDGTVGNGTELYSIEDLSRVLQNDRVRLVDQVGLRWITKLANVAGYGRIGFATKVLRQAYSIAKGRLPLTVEDLETALRMTIGRDVAEEINQVAGGELLTARVA